MTATTEWKLHKEQFWMRGEAPRSPVSYSEERKLWDVYGHPEALEVLSDPTVFSSDITAFVPPEQKTLQEGNLTALDPPEHTKLRKLVSRAFTPKVVADLEPRIRELTEELLDGITDRFELVEQLAYPLPVIVIAELLGVPSSDRHLFKKWVGRLLENTQSFSAGEPSEQEKRDRQQVIEEITKLREYLSDHAQERRNAPREDLLTKLVQAEVDGLSLSDDEVVNFAMVLLIAGHITTTMLLGNTVLQLDRSPQARDAVLADRSALPSAIEESLRLLSPFAAVSRATTAPVRLGGVEVPADQMLMVWVAAANRDARTFTDPHTFRLGRDPNPHLAFGRGIHFCLGAPLARLEGKVALNVLLDRFPNLRTDAEHPPVFHPNPGTTGVHSLQLLT